MRILLALRASCRLLTGGSLESLPKGRLRSHGQEAKSSIFAVTSNSSKEMRLMFADLEVRIYECGARRGAADQKVARPEEQGEDRQANRLQFLSLHPTAFFRNSRLEQLG